LGSFRETDNLSALRVAGRGVDSSERSAREVRSQQRDGKSLNRTHASVVGGFPFFVGKACHKCRAERLRRTARRLLRSDRQSLPREALVFATKIRAPRRELES
jgi:hypothetical protein